MVKISGSPEIVTEIFALGGVVGYFFRISLVYSQLFFYTLIVSTQLPAEIAQFLDQEELLSAPKQIPLAEKQMPEPYRSICDLPFDGHGWFMNGPQIHTILKETQPKVGIEIGSWLGASTRDIALNMPEDAILYAVDTWLGSQELAHLLDPRLPHLYQLFLSNVKHTGLTNKIIPVRMTSLEAAKALNVKADFIYIDASHDEEDVYNDICAWTPHLNESGVICGDDWGWVSVQRGVIRAALLLGKGIAAGDNFWRLI